MEWKNEKYKILYENLIYKAKSKTRSRNDCAYHNHHIIPKSIGGSNKSDNFVLLTPREHFIAHLLLLRLKNPEHRSKMYYAFLRMKECAKTAKAYQRFIDNFSKESRGENNPFFGKKHTPENLKKMSGKNHPMYGKNHSEESKAKMSKSKIGRFLGENNPMFGRQHSEEWRKEHSQKLKGKNHFNYGKPAFNAGRKWMNNGIISKMVAIDEIEYMLTNGWKIGRLPKKV